MRWRVPRQAYATPRGVLARAAASITQRAGYAGESDGKHRAMHTSCAGEGGEHNATPRVALACVASSVCSVAGCAGVCRVKRMQRCGLRWRVPRQAYAASRGVLARAAASITQRRGLRWRVPHQAHATPRVELPNAGNVNISVYNLHKYTIWRALAMLKSVLTGRRAPAID